MKTSHVSQLTLLAVLGAALCTAGTVHAASRSWDDEGGDDLWATDANWSGDTVPSGSTTDAVIMANTSAASPATVASNVPGFRQLYIGDDGASAGTGYVNVTTGGSLAVTKNTYIGDISGSTGMLNITGGTFTGAIGSNSFRVYVGGSGTGTIDISGGVYTMGHASAETHIGTGSGAGTFIVSGSADVNLNEGFIVGGGSGTGTLVIDGSVASGGDDIVNTRGVANRMQFLTNSTLKAVIDTAAILDADAMRQILITGGSNALFAGDPDGPGGVNGALLDPSFGAGVTPTSGTWTLISGSSAIVDNGLALAPGVDSGWSFDITGNTLTVTYDAIPEPATLALLGIGGLAMLYRHRT